MGDAGPATSFPLSSEPHSSTLHGDGSADSREINVLVTGFGPFKSFVVNPSFLIASALPTALEPSSQTPAAGKDTRAQTLLRPPNRSPYRIKLHTYPHAVSVAYDSTTKLIPKLISPSPPYRPAQYDWVIHIGLAAGRSNYTLETRAYRDGYKIKDIDDRDGFMSGEYKWKREGLPACLEVGWDDQDVLARWEELVEEAEIKAEKIESPPGSENNTSGQTDAKRPIVKLSRDAGRFLCEFILYTSLSTRYTEAHPQEENADGDMPASNHREEQHIAASPQTAVDEQARLAAADAVAYNSPLEEDQTKERVGKVAFLHVPGGTEPEDIARGVRVANAALLALVGSWEDGFRNASIYGET